jgi:serine/threonine protein kinase
LTRSGLEPGCALELLAQVADALDAAHEAGLVRRDVKPANVLLDSRHHCYLSDFGLTKKVSSQSGFTATGQIVARSMSRRSDAGDLSAPPRTRLDFRRRSGRRTAPPAASPCVRLPS